MRERLGLGCVLVFFNFGWCVLIMSRGLFV